MGIIATIILSIVEGVTEFLPISSTEHMQIAQNLMHIAGSDFVKSFEITIQFGAILAVVFIYRHAIFSSFKIFLKKIIIAFIPTGVVGFFLYKIIKDFLLGNMWIGAVALIAGGLMILWFEYRNRHRHASELEEVRDFESLTNFELIVMGFSQALAVVPGVSRSLAVIHAGRFMRIPKKLVTEFSFLLAIPTMLAATTYDLYKSGFAFQANEWGIILLGSALAFITAMFSVKWLINYIQTHTFSIFGWYRIILGLVILLVIL